MTNFLSQSFLIHFTSHKSMINYAECDGILETPLYLWFLWILNDQIRNFTSKKMLIAHRSMLSHWEIIWDRLVSNWLIFICTYTSMVYSPSEPVFSTYPITCTVKNLFMTRTICCSFSVWDTLFFFWLGRKFHNEYPNRWRKCKSA